jgi:hypothetical protein
VKIIIPSSGRAQLAWQRTQKLFPSATVCVAESEAEEYAKTHKDVMVHPDDITGMGPIRQWVLDNVKDPIVFMADDDLQGMFALTGTSGYRAITDPGQILAIVENAARCAREAGACVFGFNQSSDPRNFRRNRPIVLTGWIGGAIGIIGRDLRYDTSLKLRADIDFCLQSLLKHRIIWQDARYTFEQEQFTGRGGTARNRSMERHEQEIAYLQRRWGTHMQVKRRKTTIQLTVNVPRMPGA